MSHISCERTYYVEILPCYNSVYDFLLRMSGNSSDAADLTQDTFARAFQKIETYTLGTNPRAWLCRIAHNLFINQYRKRSRRGEQSLEEHDIYQRRSQGHAMSDFTDPQFDGDGFSDEVVNAIACLKETPRAILLLADVHDFSMKDIALAMECKESTVKSILHRTRIKLAELLKGFADKEYGIINMRKRR